MHKTENTDHRLPEMTKVVGRVPCPYHKKAITFSGNFIIGGVGDYRLLYLLGTVHIFTWAFFKLPRFMKLK